MSCRRALVVALMLAATACGIEPDVVADRAENIAPRLDDPVVEPAPAAPAPGTPTRPDPSDPASPTTEGATTAPVTTTAPDTVPSTTVPTPDAVTTDPTAIDFGPNKPAQPYDEFLLAAVSDIEAWWADQYPRLYGGAFEPLRGNVISAYPGRADGIPGCGTPRTTYQEVFEYAAFYCGLGDFMVYDDGDGGLLADLADRFGPATIAVVLAHEYGHAIQLRSGALDENYPTITTEQQADCFAGAWAARVAGGGTTALSFTDGDVRVSLISMLEVRDPVGLDQFSEGGHGTGFDRVGAFQVGFIEGAARCAELLDEPLPLAPTSFLGGDDFASGGNAPWGYGDGQLFGFLHEDLNLYWDVDLQSVVPTFGPLVLAPVQSIGGVDCRRLDDHFDDGVGLCLETSSVYVNEPVAFELYSQDLFGDFSIGYLLGLAWAEAAQTAIGSQLTGEARELVNDCLTGAWVRTLLPGAIDPDSTRDVSISPGDLDETVRTMILIGDDRGFDDVVGTPFDKVAAFRGGLIDGLETCLARL